MSTAQSGYLALLARPRVAQVYGAAAVARLQFGVIPLTLLLLLADRRGSYAEAGVATAGYALTAGLLGPLRARAADRHGHGRVLVLLGAANAVALLVVLVLAPAPLPLLAGAALVAGCLPPPVGPVMRAAWRRLTEGEQQLAAAYSLDTVTEEVLFVVGPLLAGVAAGRWGPPVVLALSVASLLAACVGLHATLASEAYPSGRGRPSPRRGAWRSTPFLLGLAPVTGVGLLLGAVDLAAVAATVRTAGEWAAGLPAAGLAVGSVTGGLAYGRRAWPGDARQQAVATSACSAVGIALAATLAAHLGPLLALVTLSGAFVAPALVSSYLVADAATERPTAEGTAWVNSAFNVGIAVGTALAGALVDGCGPASALLAGAMGAVMLSALSLCRHAAAPTHP